jgi:hypothetical protein
MQLLALLSAEWWLLHLAAMPASKSKQPQGDMPHSCRIKATCALPTAACQDSALSKCVSMGLTKTSDQELLLLLLLLLLPARLASLPPLLLQALELYSCSTAAT